jgi:hypothetical protein
LIVKAYREFESHPLRSILYLFFKVLALRIPPIDRQ